MTDDIIIAQTRKWLTDVVVGCNFCPFAGRELARNAIKYRIVHSDAAWTCLEALREECVFLDANPEVATTLLLLPDGFSDFEDYLDLVSMAEQIIEVEGYEGVYQVASFHPNYLFGGSHDKDPANYTNRSMVPMLHILREESVTRAVESFPGVDDIPNKNIAFATQKGLDYMQKLRAACAVVPPEGV